MRISINYYKSQDDFIKIAVDTKKQYLVFIASKTKIDLSLFNEKQIYITGARFPDIIYNGKLYDDGILCLEIQDDMELLLIEDINSFDFNNKAVLSSKSIITLLDGFCKDNEKFLSKLFENLSYNTNILGGGAGVLENNEEIIIFNNNGFYRNCALLLSLKENLKISARHGWSYLDGPFVVTSCEGNLLKTVDYMDAFEFYKKAIKRDCNIEINKENFLELAQNYPLGIIKYQGEQIVRDPISFKDGYLELLGEITNNSMINILKGNKENLLEASKDALEDVKGACSDLLIVFNCISRKKFLDDEFEKELKTIDDNNSNMFGVTTLGEIANSGNKYINFLNKTCVIGGICN